MESAPWIKPRALSSMGIGCLETYNALWRHYSGWRQGGHQPNSIDLLAKTKSRWPCDACVIHARFARDEIINLAARRFARKLRAFPKRVGPRILSLASVDYFGTSEHFWVVKKKIRRRILISKTAMFGCCKLSLYALVMSMRFIFGDDWNDVPFLITFLSLAMM